MFKKILFATVAVAAAFALEAAPALADDDSSAIGRGENVGKSTGNIADRTGADNQGMSAGSFDDAKGVFSVGQTAGENNLSQTATALAAILGEDASDNESLALASNNGQLSMNQANGTSVSHTQSISDSFKGAVGVFSVSQVSGSNNLVQTATTVAAIVK
jgi:glycerol-3-phosphate acyltransferase PlsY